MASQFAPQHVIENVTASGRDDLTALSVFFHSEALLQQNIHLTDRLNPGSRMRWLAVNNGSPKVSDLDVSRVEVLNGTPDIPFEVSRDRGSLHHSEGLMLGKGHVSTRFLLVIDPDFYVLRPRWIDDILEHMESHKLSLFGSCWHPRWWYQYRYFPTVHFMLIDLDRLPLHELDFSPGIREDRLYQTFDKATWLPDQLRTLFLIGRFKDTGHKIRESVLRQGGHSFETLVPHFVPAYQDACIGRFCRRYPRLIPEILSRTPTRRNAFTEQTFLRDIAPEGYSLGWEEFFWQDKPFAVHLRNVGRGKSTSAEHPELQSLLQSQWGVQDLF